MARLLFVLVIIGALFVIASGVWVAVALAKAVLTKSKPQDESMIATKTPRH